MERIQQMFPQTSRRCIMWDLQRNGGNVAATTERILSGRGLETVSLPLVLFFRKAYFQVVCRSDCALSRKTGLP